MQSELNIMELSWLW